MIHFTRRLPGNLMGSDRTAPASDRKCPVRSVTLPLAALAMFIIPSIVALADTTPLVILDPNLQVTTYVSGLSQPIGIVFLSSTDALVLEKASGQIKRVISGVVQPTPVLDLAVNSASERGLLSMALDPNFATNNFA